jgi:hypothetical protein
MKARVISINTTAFEEENLLLFTTLTDEQIVKVITPIVEAERQDEEQWYDNDILVQALEDAYPNEVVHRYDIEYLSI